MSVCVTWDHREFLTAGANYYRIGVSEFLRRVLDKQMRGDTVDVPKPDQLVRHS
jgi:hypothetical protein